jgi:hypothetical protein
VKLAAKWWGCDPLALMKDEGAETLIRRALVAIGAEADAEEFAQKKALVDSKVKNGGRRGRR